MSHHTSRIDEMHSESIRVDMNASKSTQSAICGGRPAVGNDSKTFDRADDKPESSPSKYGLDADNASRSGRCRVISLMIEIALSPSLTPT